MGTQNRMSIPTIKWAWEYKPKVVKLLPSTKLVLLSLADHSKECGCCFPSTIRIAKLTGLSQRTVQHHIKTLCELGALMRVKGGFKLMLPSELDVPCSATGCTLKARSVASTISTKVDINNRNNEPTNTPVHVPEWLKVINLTTDNALIDNIENPTIKSWVDDIEKDYLEIDILSEAKKYALWWEDKKAKKPKLAFRNWLDKARTHNGKHTGRTTKGRPTPVSETIDEYIRSIAEKQKQYRDSGE